MLLQFSKHSPTYRQGLQGTLGIWSGIVSWVAPHCIRISNPHSLKLLRTVISWVLLPRNCTVLWTRRQTQDVTQRRITIVCGSPAELPCLQLCSPERISHHCCLRWVRAFGGCVPNTQVPSLRNHFEQSWIMILDAWYSIVCNTTSVLFLMDFLGPGLSPHCHSWQAAHYLFTVWSKGAPDLRSQALFRGQPKFSP